MINKINIFLYFYYIEKGFIITQARTYNQVSYLKGFFYQTYLYGVETIRNSVSYKIRCTDKKGKIEYIKKIPIE